MQINPQSHPRPLPEMAERANLLFCVNRRFLPLLSTCLRSVLLRGGYEQYAVYLLHSDLEQADMDGLEAEFADRTEFFFIPVPEELFTGFPESSRYPRQIYYRLAAPLLLPGEMERVLYLDVDTVVINPLEELYQMDFEGNYYVGCTHTKEFLTRLNQTRLKSEKAVAYINTGVLLLNLPALRENLRLDQIREYVCTRKHALFLPDQDILTALYGDKVKLADTMRYNLSDRMLMFWNADLTNEKRDLSWVRENAVVIHYCGKNKPWTDRYVGALGIFYQELLEQTACGRRL